MVRIGARPAGGALAVVLNLGAWAAAFAQPGLERLAPEIEGLAPLSEVLALETPAVSAAIAAARAASEVGGPAPFAAPFAVDVSTASHGRWESSSDGRLAVWRLRVVSAAAVSLNLGFGRYRMPPGGRLRVYTPAGGEVAGPFTEADNRPHGELWTPILSGDEVVIEVAVPAARLGQLELRLDTVNRGFRDLSWVRSPSHGSCNIDVACPAGDASRDQIRSVAHWSVGGASMCTGALVNNAAEDSRLFFLTAAHCFHDARRQAPSVVVYWNFQRPACDAGAARRRRHSQSGAVLRFQDAASDLVLLELDDEPDPAHKLHLAGWDLSSAAPASATTIHHPHAHHKSISSENDPLTRTTYNNDRPRYDGRYWRVEDWDQGTTQPGSSGAPLFDQNGRIVGALSGGDAACGNDEPDWYGALASSADRLSGWLDPGDTGAISLDGMDPNHRPRSLRAPDDKAVRAPEGGVPAAALPVDLAPFFRDPDGDALTYAATSSNESFVTASVSGSSVDLTPVAAGVATITVTATDAGGSNLAATRTFQVKVGANRSPETSGTLAGQSLNEGDTTRIDVASSFTDDDGDDLTLAASSTDTAVATAALSGSTVTVTAADGPGAATIDVTATDAGGSNTRTRHRFVVTVANEAPRPVGSLADVTINVGDDRRVVDVARAFDDPEGEALTYRASSSAPRVARAAASGSRVRLTPVARGNATITVRATDLGGSVETATQTIDARVKGRRGVTLSTTDLSVTEGATAAYTVALDSEPTGEVTIAASVVSSAKITVSPLSLTFDETDWDSARTVTVEGVQDGDAVAESATIRHDVSGGDYGPVTAPSVSVKVLDDDAAPVLSVAPASAAESAGSVSFEATLAFAAGVDVTVDYATSDGSGAAGARAGSDYASANGTLTFPTGTTTKRIVVAVTDDDEDEEEAETFRLTLRNPRNATLDGGGSTLRVPGTIEDDDDPEVTARFGSSNYTVTEGRSVNVVVRLDRDPERNVEIFLHDAHRGGVEDADYRGVPTSVEFGAGERTRSFTVDAFNDGLDEDGEAVELSLSTAAARVTADDRTTIAIRDSGGGPPGGNDPPGGDDTPGGGPPGGNDTPGGGPPDGEEEEDDPPRPPPPPQPPTAAFATEGAVCDGGLCRAHTGSPVTFADTSTGALTTRRWEFGDGRLSRSRTVAHSWSAPGFYEVTLTVSNGAVESTAALTFLVEADEPAGSCVADARTRCLRDSRYAASVDWWRADGAGGGGEVVRSGTDDSGVFRFLEPENWEVLIKVLDGCAVNGHVWVFGASPTDLGYVIRVTDTAAGTVKEYRNEPGAPAPAITDVTAFPAGCPR